MNLNLFRCHDFGYVIPPLFMRLLSNLQGPCMILLSPLGLLFHREKCVGLFTRVLLKPLPADGCMLVCCHVNRTYIKRALLRSSWNKKITSATQTKFFVITEHSILHYFPTPRALLWSSEGERKGKLAPCLTSSLVPILFLLQDRITKDSKQINSLFKHCYQKLCMAEFPENHQHMENFFKDLQFPRLSLIKTTYLEKGTANKSDEQHHVALTECLPSKWWHLWSLGAKSSHSSVWQLPSPCSPQVFNYT